MRKVSLYTSFHPDIGGGGVNLRTLISNFSQVAVQWYYSGTSPSTFPNTICLGPGIVGGPVWKDIPSSLAMWAGQKKRYFSSIEQKMLATNPDVLWVLAMNEGIPLGNRILDQGSKPLHVSVQDDQARGIAPRSKRYWWMAPMMLRSWQRLLCRARSVDVTSDGMQSAYQRLHGISSMVCHPYIPTLPKLPTFEPKPGQLRIGHIGSIYNPAVFERFLLACADVARQRGDTISLVLVGGGALDHLMIKRSLGPDSIVRAMPSLEESEAVRHLATCDFVYAMYPFDGRSAFFRETSLPTKLSTYIQSQRPIFAHTPAGSTLAAMFQQHSLGKVCSSESAGEIRQSITQILLQDAPPAIFESVRSEVYGLDNVDSLERALTSA